MYLCTAAGVFFGSVFSPVALYGVLAILSAVGLKNTIHMHFRLFSCMMKSFH